MTSSRGGGLEKMTVDDRGGAGGGIIKVLICGDVLCEQSLFLFIKF